RRSSFVSLRKSVPRYRISPPVGSARPSSRRAKVVLPEPLSPTTAMIKGVSAWTASDSPASPSALSRPSPPENCLLISTAAISGTTASREMAGHFAAIDAAQERALLAAALRRQGAARMKRASGRQIAQQRRQTGDAGEGAARLERGECGDQ